MDNNYIGKKVDNRYDVISLIGVGGMSNVYKAIDTLTGETVAIKFLKQEFFENEALLAACEQGGDNHNTESLSEIAFSTAYAAAQSVLEQ